VRLAIRGISDDAAVGGQGPKAVKKVADVVQTGAADAGNVADDEDEAVGTKTLDGLDAAGAVAADNHECTASHGRGEASSSEDFSSSSEEERATGEEELLTGPE